ncbi:MAG: hypothetical protein B6I26_08340 [Desulfobacteraceae bacterium 4572_130]|nr:MAG: hypothetical protein B6I26_08340 [Desulfobacteraceae bacterium 4572_130]
MRVKQIKAIALLTFKQALGGKAVYGIILGAFFCSAITIGLAGFFMHDIDKVAIDFTLSFISFCSLILLFFVGANLILNDINKKTIYFILSKPFSRQEYIIGKLAGLIFFCTTGIIIFSIAGFITIIIIKYMYSAYFKDFIWSLFFTAIYAHILMVALLNSIILFFSTITFNSFLILISSITTYIVGQTIEEIYFYIKNQTSIIPLSYFVENTINAMYYIAPNLALFDLKTNAAHCIPISKTYILSITFYAVTYIILITTASCIIFSKRDLP